MLSVEILRPRLTGVSCAIHGRVVRVRNKVLRASPEGPFAC